MTRQTEVRDSRHQASCWPRYRSSAGEHGKPLKAHIELPGSHSRRSDWRHGWLSSGSWLSGDVWWPGGADHGSHSRWRSWRGGQRWTQSGENWPPSWPECGLSSCETRRRRRGCQFLILTRAAEVSKNRNCCLMISFRKVLVIVLPFTVIHLHENIITIVHAVHLCLFYMPSSWVWLF